MKQNKAYPMGIRDDGVVSILVGGTIVFATSSTSSTLNNPTLILMDVCKF